MSKWVTIPVGPYTPDMPDFQNPGSAYVLNALPKTIQSYGPMPSFASIYGAITRRSQGAYAGLDSSGNVIVVAGDSSDLYRMASGDASPQNASKSAAAYSCPNDGQWRYAYFNGSIIATDFNDAIQALDINSGTKFADLAAAAPKARYVAAVKGFLMVGNTFDGTDGNQPQRVWWSGLNDATNWPTPGTTTAAQFQSDFNDLLGEGGWIQGIAGNLGTADAAIFMEHAIWRAVYVGPPAVFNFYPATAAKGCLAPGSLVQVGNMAYYLGEDGFYAFDGTNAQPIGYQKVDRTVISDLDSSFLDRVYSAVDPTNKLIFWIYPGAQNNNGLCNRLLAYNYALDRWSLSEASFETIFRSMSFGYTLEQLDAFGTLEILPFSLDSREWTGGQVLLAGVNNLHEIGSFGGANLAPIVETSESEVAPGKRVMVRQARPLVDAGAPTVSIGMRERLVDSVTWSAASAMNAVGVCPTRAAGRYSRARVSLPAGTDFNHIQGIQADIEPLGER